MKSLYVRCALLGALLLPAAAQARDLVLPLEPALQSAGRLLAPDFPVRFGRATAQGLETISTVEVRGIGDRWAPINTSMGSTRRRLKDDEACLDGFHKAVAELQKRARAAGATAVVGIVGNQSAELEGSNTYQCQLGLMRVVVDLKGQATREAVRAGAVSTTTPASPAARSLLATQSLPAPRVHGISPPPATGYAGIHEVARVPFQSESNQQRYSEWLLKPAPRAVAIHPTGLAWFSWGNADAIETALRKCEESARAACFLYAVDEQVVWSPDPGKRVTLQSLGR